MAIEVHIGPSRGAFKYEVGLFLTYSNLDKLPVYIGHTTQMVEVNGTQVKALVYWLSGEPDEEAVALWAADVEQAVTAFVESGKTQRAKKHSSVGTIGELVLRTGGECDPRETGFAQAERVADKYRQMNYRK